ncbi:MAG TPA: hypothetical protein VL086_00840 [Candidatus Nitrosotalea sp.]|nr:hypothetical protein [Candidatus Nitrosotalea sp.]
MSGFDELWESAVDALPGRRDALRDRLRPVSFPAALSILAVGQTRSAGPDGDLLQLVSRQAGGADGDRLQRALKRLFVTRTPPGKTTSADVLGQALQAAGGIARPGVPVTPTEALKVLELLRTGEFFGDVASTTSAVVQLTRELPRALIRDIPRTPFTLAELGGALVRDGVGAIGHVGDTVRDLLDGHLDRPPHTMSHTLRWLYGNAGAAAVAEAVRRIIAPENETARLAILIYARANGIPLTPEGLDALYNGPLNTADPDLGPALAAGVDALAARRGDRGVLTLLGKLHR